MADNLQIRKQLAALASFRILFDKQKDSYEVLRCFIRNTIAKYSMRLFTVAELLSKLEEDFGFGKLPVFVVEKAVRQLTSSHGKDGYTCDVLPQDEPELDKELKQSDKSIQRVLNLLYQYVEDKRSAPLLDAEKQKLENDLSVFLLTNRAEDDAAVVISSFVIENSQNKEIQDTLDEMREGMILYSGLSYSTTKDASEKWKNPINVYLDTELLFHATGLNGELKKKVWSDFKELVDEINSDSVSKGGKLKIRFKCFDYVYKEVDAVFGNAQDIIEGKAKLAPGKTAQSLLIQGVRDASEIVRKRVEFDETIKSLGVQNDDESEGFYSVSTYAFNLEDKELLEKLKKSFPEDYRMTEKKIMDSLQSLSYVNVRRKNHAPKDIEQSRVILLTEDNTTKRVSHFPDIKKPGIVPLCTDLYYFTNRLWIKLGKGFGATTTPSIFSSANKARFIISSKLDMIVADEYAKLCEEYEAGKLSESKATSYLYKLKTMAKSPEEIESSDIVDLNLSVNGNRLEQHLQEQALKDAVHKKTVQKFAEQTKVVSKYEEQEAFVEYGKDLDYYKKKRNKAYNSALCDARHTVITMIMLVLISVLLGIVTRLNDKCIWITIIASVIPLLPGFIWYLARSANVVSSFQYCFIKSTRAGLKRKVIEEILKTTQRPIFSEILVHIKERNGSLQQ